MPTSRTFALFALGAVMVAPTACKRHDLDNPDVASDYRGSNKNKYEEDIVTARKRKDYADQGKGIDPRTLSSIEDTINTVYLRDLERCLEDEMSTHNTRFLRSVSTIEFHIDTKGKAGAAKILKMWYAKQDAKGTNVGELDPKDLKDCFVTSIAEWEFDPPPEVEYVHTYEAKVGEGF